MVMRTASELRNVAAELRDAMGRLLALELETFAADVRCEVLEKLTVKVKEIEGAAIKQEHSAV